MAHAPQRGGGARRSEPTIDLTTGAPDQFGAHSVGRLAMPTVRRPFAVDLDDRARQDRVAGSASYNDQFVESEIRNHVG